MTGLLLIARPHHGCAFTRVVQKHNGAACISGYGLHVPNNLRHRPASVLLLNVEAPQRVQDHQATTFSGSFESIERASSTDGGAWTDQGLNEQTSRHGLPCRCVEVCTCAV